MFRPTAGHLLFDTTKESALKIIKIKNSVRLVAFIIVRTLDTKKVRRYHISKGFKTFNIKEVINFGFVLIYHTDIKYFLS